MSNQTRLDHVLQKWIDMNGQATPVNWKTVLDVVKGPLVKNYDLAKKIEQDLKQESSEQQNVTSKRASTNAYNVEPL